MKKKQFEAVAQVLRESMPTDPKDLKNWRIVVDSLADQFELENHRFDRIRFIRSCTLK